MSWRPRRKQRGCWKSSNSNATKGRVWTAAEHRVRWPHFVDAALSAGFASVHAVPMRVHANVLGTLGLFGTRAGTLNEGDLALAQALAHVASIALVHGSNPPDPAAVGAALATTLRHRATLEQAKGLLSYVGGLDMDQAFAVMRRYCRDHDVALAEVAERLVHRILSPRSVLANVTGIQSERHD